MIKFKDFHGNTFKFNTGFSIMEGSLQSVKY